MGLESTGETDNASRCRLAFRFAIDGDLRFISHHDTMRLFRRALARAGLPVRFSQGFNPQPKIVLPLPRPVGIASDDETVLVEFDETVDPTDAANRLADQLPTQMHLHDVNPVAIGRAPQPREVHYRLEPDADWPDDLAQRIDRLRHAEDIRVERYSPKLKRTRIIDIRPYLVDVTQDGPCVLFTIRSGREGSAKPSEVAGELGLDAAHINHCIRRLKVRWQEPGKRWSHADRNERDRGAENHGQEDQEEIQGT